MSRELTLLHTSDLQCGRPFLPDAADALVRLAASVAPDVIIAAGDLTQRAKASEFGMALEIFRRLPDVPIVTTPGNHDVPLYRLWERAFAPFAKWRRFISDDLDTVTKVDGATIVTLCSAAPRRAIVNGRIDAPQIDFAVKAFESSPADDFRCLVIHHHFVPVADGEGGRPLPGARKRLEAIERAGVDVVLGGHVHQLHLSNSRAVLGDRPGPGVPIVACGTTTSRRGRGAEAGANSLTVLSVTADDLSVTPYVRARGGSDFEPGEAVVYSRPTSRKGAALGEAGT